MISQVISQGSSAWHSPRRPVSFFASLLADVLPDMEFHRHNRVQLTAALLAGIALGWAIHLLEPAHSHEAWACRIDRRGGRRRKSENLTARQRPIFGICRGWLAGCESSR